MGINFFGTLFVLLNTLKQGYEGDIIFFFYGNFKQSRDHLFFECSFHMQNSEQSYAFVSVSPISMFLGLSSQVGIDKLKRGLLLSTSHNLKHTNKSTAQFIKQNIFLNHK